MAQSVSFGFGPECFGGADSSGTPPDIQHKTNDSNFERKKTFADTDDSLDLRMADRHKGLGDGNGGVLMRSALGSAAYASLDPVQRARTLRYKPAEHVLRKNKFTPLPAHITDGSESRPTPRQFYDSVALTAGPEPEGMFKQLLLSDLSWATEPAAPDDLLAVSEHRWSFRGAADLAGKSQSHCFFVRCLLDMQRNVQCEEEGDALDPRYIKVCKSFVCGQCGRGRPGDMYQLLLHFVSNAPIFDEWARYLSGAFQDTRANQEAFLVPHVEQVWFRFCRMLPALEEIFQVLNTRFVGQHRLPMVGDVVRESMRRRCFSSKAVTTNEMFSQEKYVNDTIKNVRRCFRIGL